MCRAHNHQRGTCHVTTQLYDTVSHSLSPLPQTQCQRRLLSSNALALMTQNIPTRILWAWSPWEFTAIAGSDSKIEAPLPDMQSFKAAPPNHEFYCHSSSYLRGEDGSRNQTRFSDFGELEQSAPIFHNNNTVGLSSSSMFHMTSDSLSTVPKNPYYGTALNTSIGSSEMVSASTGGVDTGQFMYQKGSLIATALANCTFENWGDSGVVADNCHSQQTDTSTDPDTNDTDDKTQFNGVQQGALVVVDSMDQSNAKTGDRKALRRLAQNREAARKSRLRKKAYVHELENSRIKLAQLEQELHRAREQGMFVGSGTPGDQSHSGGALAFNMEYARWLDDHQRLISDLRSALNSLMGDTDLHRLVNGVMAHYDEIFRLKTIATKADAFHILSGMWKTPAERFFMWLGGFRSSELLKILGIHLEPLTDQQLIGICNLQQSSQQAEDALSQGMEALQQSLVDTLSSATLSPSGSGNVADYMGQMAIAMSKLATIESFLHQADLLRKQTLQQLHRILTTRQAARALLVIGDYSSRLQALSCLWLARPRD